MRILIAIILLFCFVRCTNSVEEKESFFSTVDSNTVGTTDTVPAILYLDNPKLDSFPMAMDSAGPTIEPEDTLYNKSAPYKVTE